MIIAFFVLQGIVIGVIFSKKIDTYDLPLM